MNLAIVVVALLGATVLMTDRAPEDWRFAGYFLVAYLLIMMVQWVWRTRRHE
ncbi:hypothetical protein [Aeromicrobium duanguangcaii]|uniref:Uncharacterized protein n=1 Tax=Aeromicrobium duanguangcaii TaxID=2968086 RepID=A0ABY5KI14_9ACTN|nr:hypothetical protein [Aeromicrobium duanguangcaii]MCL3838700.1 hypothetical protein [Aeromicrobium duanguangcaii]UUI68003.1 hypothetical protein NP095_12435 [Aeromicrobium duanguangcaii]